MVCLKHKMKWMRAEAEKKEHKRMKKKYNKYTHTHARRRRRRRECCTYKYSLLRCISFGLIVFRKSKRQSLQLCLDRFSSASCFIFFLRLVYTLEFVLVVVLCLHWTFSKIHLFGCARHLLLCNDPFGLTCFIFF